MKAHGEEAILLLDSTGAALAQARLEGPADGPALQLFVLEGKAGEAAAHEVIQVVGMGESGLALQCQTVRRQGERIVLNKVAQLGPDFRLNLRVPVRFQSFLYPVSGAWRGRMALQSVELSCSGIAFYAPPGLSVRETVEVVIPIAQQPLILRCTVQTQKPLQAWRSFYAAEFSDLCHDEESLLRKAVFRQQLAQRPRRTEEKKKAEVET